jgi:hypothetical protein
LAVQLEHVGQRYKDLKGKYWTLLSEYIRRRDFNDRARVFPAVEQFPIGESLMQVILSPQEGRIFSTF